MHTVYRNWLNPICGALSFSEISGLVSMEWGCVGIPMPNNNNNSIIEIQTLSYSMTICGHCAELLCLIRQRHKCRRYSHCQSKSDYFCLNNWMPILCIATVWNRFVCTLALLYSLLCPSVSTFKEVSCYFLFKIEKSWFSHNSEKTTKQNNALIIY